MGWVKVEYAGGVEKWINLDNVVEVNVTPARERVEIKSHEEAAEWNYPRDNVVPARPLVVEIITNAATSVFDSGGDYPEFKHTEFHPHVIKLQGKEAGQFLYRLQAVPQTGVEA